MQNLRILVIILLGVIAGCAVMAVGVATHWAMNRGSAPTAQFSDTDLLSFRPASDAIFHLCPTLEDLDGFLDTVVRSNYWLAAMALEKHQEKCPAYTLKHPEITVEVISRTPAPLSGYDALILAKITFTDLGDRYLALMQKQTTGLAEGAQHSILAYRTENGITEALNEALSGD
ncbi:hypothetical protein PARHAE_01831 [Paracoccus haematequi]|jgi:hypothetical protein|uniref:Uncharacterized protein n=2 Tax=Paracoccus haematequi TaxID=2491866 RepID=A0A447IMA7_9RHOB|nr:hypothetical protein PARHAE_01831 [Paracoccus haematequi]